MNDIVKVQSFVTVKTEVFPATVEVCLTDGIGIHLVGLPDKDVKDCILRTFTALQSLGYSIPGKKIVINILPLHKGMCGRGLDLPIAVGVLAACGKESLPEKPDISLFGELGLDGSIRPCGQEDKIAGYCGNGLIITKDECSSICGNTHSEKVYCATSLQQAVEILKAEPLQRRRYESK